MSRITAVVKGTATTTHTECLSAFTLRLEPTNICVGTNYRAHGSDNIISHRVILDLWYYFLLVIYTITQNDLYITSED